MLLAFFCFPNHVQAEQLNKKEGISKIELALNKIEFSEKNVVLLDVLNDLNQFDFINEEEYIQFLSAIEPLVTKNAPKEMEVLFHLGNTLQRFKKFKEAYPFLYRVGIFIKENPGEFTYECVYYETMGNSYYFFRRNELSEAIFLKGVECPGTTKQMLINIYNTLGLIQNREKDIVTAEDYFRKAYAIAQEINHEPWKGVISGNLGHLYFKKKEYRKAKDYLWADYNIGKDKNQWGTSIHALALLLEIDLVQGNMNGAKAKMDELDTIYQKDGGLDILIAYYTSKSNYLEKVGNHKEALKYYKKTEAVRDSVSVSRDISVINNAEFQIEFEHKQSEIMVLEETKKSDEQRIYGLLIIIVTIVFGSIIIFWQVAKRRKQEKELLELKNRSIQNELQRSKAELKNVIKNLIEKNDVITKLNDELEIAHTETISKSDEEKSIITNRLQSFTLLTEEDWIEFKRLFEKCFPGFFDYFHKQFTDITNAEIRLAALIKLDLENLEMSKTLGISPDSVRKTNLRLRKKLGISEQKELIDLIHSI